MNKNLLNDIQAKIKLTNEEVETLHPFWIQKRIAKNEYLVRNGDVCKYDSYVISGSFKAFYIHPQTGKEEILFFAGEGDVFITLTKRPATEIIRKMINL